MLQSVAQNIKESVVMTLSEIVSRTTVQLVYEILGKNVSKTTLPLKVGSITKMAVTAANKLSFGPADAPIDMESVKDSMVKKCFPTFSPSASQSTTSQEVTAAISS